MKDGTFCPDSFKNSNSDHHWPTLKVKHINIIGEYSCFVFVLDKGTLQHVVLQSVLTTLKDETLQQVTRTPWCESEFFLQFVQEVVLKEPSPITWIIYENSFCPIDYYMNLVKYQTQSPGLYFATDDHFKCLDRIYSDRRENSFNVEKVAIHFIISLFEIVEHLNKINLHTLFYLDNILITDSGKLKLFPSLEDITLCNRNKDPEDIVNDMLTSQENIDTCAKVLKGIQMNKEDVRDNLDYLRNLFAAGLISVRLLFRNWSPFTITNLPKRLWKHLNIRVTKDPHINQEIWLIRTVLDPLISEGFINKGLSSSCSDDNMTSKEVLKFLMPIFHPRSKRMNDPDIIRAIKSKNNFPNDRESFSAFLNEHYSVLLCGDQNNSGVRNNSNRKRTCGMNTCGGPSTPNNPETNETEATCNFEGISNWMNDSQSFMELYSKPEMEDFPQVMPEEMQCKTCASSAGNEEDFQAKLDFAPSMDTEEYPPKPMVFNFDLSANESQSGCNAMDKVFPIFKTSENSDFIKYMSTKAKQIKLLVGKTPKPVITCYPKGHCTLQYNFDQFEMHLENIPLKHITDDMDNFNSSNQLGFPEDLDDDDVEYSEESHDGDVQDALAFTD